MGPLSHGWFIQRWATWGRVLCNGDIKVGTDRGFRCGYFRALATRLKVQVLFLVRNMVPNSRLNIFFPFGNQDPNGSYMCGVCFLQVLAAKTWFFLYISLIPLSTIGLGPGFQT